jgi:hypothetical protein
MNKKTKITQQVQPEPTTTHVSEVQTPAKKWFKTIGSGITSALTNDTVLTITAYVGVGLLIFAALGVIVPWFAPLTAFVAAHLAVCIAVPGLTIAVKFLKHAYNAHQATIATHDLLADAQQHDGPIDVNIVGGTIPAPAAT